MTRYIDVNDLSYLVSQKGLQTCITEMAEYIRADYLRWQDFRKMRTPGQPLAGRRDRADADVRRVAVRLQVRQRPPEEHPDRHAHGDGLWCVGDVDTGTPLLLSEMTLTTAIRTAATSVLAARYLARTNSRSMALIGNGSQSEFQALAFHTLLGIEEIRLYDVDPKATAKLAANLSAFPAIKVILAGSVAEAVRGADIVTTVTADKTYATILTPDMIEPGMHLNAVGGDCPGKTELHRDIVERARVIVEYEPQSRIEGEIQHMPQDSPVTEFWQVVNGQWSAARTRAKITLFDSVGFALEDYSALRYVLDVAKALDMGSEIELVPDLQDPKDLFARLAQSYCTAQKARLRRLPARQGVAGRKLLSRCCCARLNHPFGYSHARASTCAYSADPWRTP